MFCFSVFSVRLFVCLFFVVGYFRKKRYLIMESYDKKVNLQRPVASVASMRQLKSEVSILSDRTTRLTSLSG